MRTSLPGARHEASVVARCCPLAPSKSAICPQVQAASGRAAGSGCECRGVARARMYEAAERCKTRPSGGAIAAMGANDMVLFFFSIGLSAANTSLNDIAA